MEVKFIDLGVIALSYIEKNPEKEQTIFFIHGNSGSCRTWDGQFSSYDLDNYRLIAFDLPGCGRSFIVDSISWDYSPLATGKLLAEAIGLLSKNNSYCLVGFSYGTNLVAETLNHGTRPLGISLLSSCVAGVGYGFDKIFVPADSVFFHDDINEDQVRDFFADILLAAGSDGVQRYTEDFLKAGPPFRSALLQSVVQGKLSDEVVLLKQQGMPVQIIFGGEDKLLFINYLDDMPFRTWRNTIYKLPAAGHYLHADAAVVFNKLLSEYLCDALQQAMPGSMT